MKKDKKYVYIFIRKDLPNSQKVVQSCHAALEVGRRFVSSHDVHPSMVLIGVKGKIQLENVAKKVKTQGFRLMEFFEPLFDGEMTSFATEPISDEERGFFKRFNLIKDSNFQIKEDRKEKLIIKLSPCTHKETEVDYIETFAYEFTPKIVCKKCKKVIEGTISEEEKESLLKRFYDEIELTPEEIEEKKNGFNL